MTGAGIVTVVRCAAICGAQRGGRTAKVGLLTVDNCTPHMIQLAYEHREKDPGQNQLGDNAGAESQVRPRGRHAI